ncbi:uncharacterized protein LOC135123299 [Zophobas morio]|uniref:uncharacterized protein LOC135123299 n=1 Tax=Zophobas morio TaxID=2755281 RepID=UPI003082E682
MLFFHLFFYFLVTSAEETYENSTEICQRCSCNDAQIFELDCSNESLTLMLANWPTQKPIKATFTGNNFTKLEKLPPTESSVEIVLSKCNIQYLDPAVFDTATKTKLVDLSYNLLVSEEVTSDKFRGPIKDNRPQPIGIEDLNLAYNKIHSLNKDVFEFLPNLTRLNLEGNDFRVLDAHTQLALANVPGLTSLNLANNELTELIPDAIEKLTKLVELDLSKNDLDFVPYSLETVGTSLEVLIVDDNPIFEMAENTFSKLPNIVEISANNLTQLTHINASTFASNLKLTKLNLRNNVALQAIDPAAFSPQSTLKELHLDNTNLTGLPLSLLNWTSLDSLTLQGAPLTCNCDLFRISASLPHTANNNEDGPICTHPLTSIRNHILFFSSDICEAKKPINKTKEDPDSICKSCGCWTSEDDLVMNINCANKNLEHVGGYWEVKKETKFVKISFAGNEMPTLEAMPQTDAVVEIVLTRCNIRYLRPSLFADTPNVKFVDLSYNALPAEELSSENFRGPFNNTFYEPIALEHLDLSYNQIHTLVNNLFEHMPNIKILNLEGNDFKVLDIQTQLALSSIRRLQDLNLANNELTEMIVGAIDAHENLTHLDLSRNLLDFVPPSLALIGKSLEVLNVDGNPIIEFGSETFRGLWNITELSANNLTTLMYIDANTFAAMPKLKKLSLSDNFLLMDIDREAFGINQTLEEFYLNNNELYRLDYKLLPWSKLHVFQFKENPLECWCDLYNITTQLSANIMREEDEPYCEDPRNGRSIRVFSLKSDICSYKRELSSHRDHIQYHFSMVTVLIAGILAVILGLVRYKKYRRESNDPYASQIAYNPVSTKVLKKGYI